MTVVLVRYCEIGLKSTPVRKRFESILRDNILGMLASDGVEAMINFADARYYITTDDIDGCVNSVKKVFGVSSLSVAEECSSDMDDICESMGKYSLGKISENQSFAVKARREGTHPYTSMDVGREAGSAIFLANEKLNVKVDLTNPDKTFYVEVRNNKAYYFDSYIRCPGGLPMGTQGKVIADVNDSRGLVSAWMMMKRGCRVFVKGDYRLDLLKKYDPRLKTVDGGEKFLFEAVGKVSGMSADNFSPEKSELPIYYPTVGMSDSEVSSILKIIENADF